MHIALCNIVKDNSEYESWKLMVESVAPHVDSVHITANGNNCGKIAKYCKDHGYDYQHIPWNNDFSEQRNANFEQAKDADYLIWLDSDDSLIGGEYLRGVCRGAKKRELDAIFLYYWYGCDFGGREPLPENLLDLELYHFRERIFKPGRVEWKKRVHESPVQLPGIDYKYAHISHTLEKPHKDFPMAILHRGADRHIKVEDMDRRMDRNRKLLELQLLDERKAGQADPRTLLYLMKIYVESKDPDLWKKSIYMGEEYMKTSGWDEERAKCVSMMAESYGNLGDHEAAMKMLHIAIKEWPHDPTYKLMLAQAYWNLEDYGKMKRWLEDGLAMDIDEKTSHMVNLIQMKIMAAKLLIRLYTQVEPDTDKALEWAETLFKHEPNQDNLDLLKYYQRLKSLNDASGHVDKLIEYYSNENEQEAIESVLNSLPSEIEKLPFVSKLKNKHLTPKKWASNEICYFANFGGKHFENWSPKNLAKGIGGSETAVIHLAKEWAKLGYKVTVYGDPGKEEGEHDGVLYLPYYKFNRRDHFNVFIQWRSNSYAGKIKCKKYLVDLHDIFSPADYRSVDNLDKLMVKSKYHRDIAPDVPDNKFAIIGNGI